MKLLTKFNLVFLLVFGAGMAVTGYLGYGLLRDNARQEVVQQARLIMDTMLSARNYTTKQIKPLLQNEQEHIRSFLPQTVPAYAATENFNYLKGAWPDYEYKEAALNPTNLRDRAVDWEADVINSFRDHPQQKLLVGERDTATGRALYLAKPITADPPCLDCHDTPRRAPASLVRHYGSANGFGWKEGEVIGAQLVSVPMSVPIQMADRAFRDLLIYLAAIFLVSMVLLDLLLLAAIVRPAGRLAAMADQVSTGNLNAPELPVKGKDEIATLASSFNRMRLSLVKALKLLEEQ
jgi:HAMP domain-containing protein